VNHSGPGPEWFGYGSVVGGSEAGMPSPRGASVGGKAGASSGSGACTPEYHIASGILPNAAYGFQISPPVSQPTRQYGEMRSAMRWASASTAASMVPPRTISATAEPS
jgi:hypothetical protein